MGQFESDEGRITDDYREESSTQLDEQGTCGESDCMISTIRRGSMERETLDVCPVWPWVAEHVGFLLSARNDVCGGNPGGPLGKLTEATTGGFIVAWHLAHEQRREDEMM